MGGDRTCPDNCIIAAWYELPEDQRTKERRRPLVEQLAKQAYTQEAIARQLGVSQMTISRDIETLNIVFNVKGQGKDTRGRKKSTGRPKGDGKRKGKVPEPKPHYKDTEIVALADAGKTMPEIAERFDISTRTVRRVLEAEGNQRKGAKDRTVDPSTLSMTAQKKLEIAKRALECKLMAENTARMHNIDEEVRQRVLKEGKEYLAMLKKREDNLYEKEKWYRTLINNHRSPFTVDEYKSILVCLHPDGERTPVKLQVAFVLFTSKKEILTGEQEKKRVAAR
jgi:DNA-binding CsgD family transcriptional regulator